MINTECYLILVTVVSNLRNNDRFCFICLILFKTSSVQIIVSVFIPKIPKNRAVFVIMTVFKKIIRVVL